MTPPVNDLSFGAALIALQEGQRVTRAGWNEANMFLQLQVPDEHSKMQQPYIYMIPVDGKLVPWLASQTDMLAQDWQVIEVN